MTEAIAVEIPLLSPNEPEARLADLLVAEGEQVEADQVLATVETTKTSAELTAPQAGFVVGLAVEVGRSLAAGEVLLWVAKRPDWQAPTRDEGAEEAPIGRRLTEPARELAAARGVQLESLPAGPLITEEWLSDWLAAQEELPAIDGAKLIVYGAGGHGESVIDLIRAVGGYDIVGVIDDGRAPGDGVLGVEILGGGERLLSLRRQGIGLAANAVGGIGGIGSRVAVFDRLRSAAFECPALVHPTAFVEENATLSMGVQIFPHAYVGSQAELGYGVIVNTAAVVSHDCQLADFVNVAPGALLAGAVRIGEGTLIGMGVTVNLEVEIGAGARVGNSAVIKRAVPPGMVVGAGAIWPPDGAGGEA